MEHRTKLRQIAARMDENPSRPQVVNAIRDLAEILEHTLARLDEADERQRQDA